MNVPVLLRPWIFSTLCILVNVTGLVSILFLCRYVEKYGLSEPCDDIFQLLTSLAVGHDNFVKRRIDGEWFNSNRDFSSNLSLKHP